MKETTIQLRYNPYESDKRLRFQFGSQNGWIPLDSASRLKRFEGRFSLQHHMDEIIAELKRSYCAKGGLCHVQFCGTVEDYEDFAGALKRIEGEGSKEKSVGCLDCVHTLVLVSAEKANERIKNTYDSLSRVLETIENENAVTSALAKYTSTEKPEFILCVVGTFSSGKSAFINSLIGEEIIPSAYNTKTNAIYRIRLAKPDETLAIEFQGQKISITKDNQYRIELLSSESTEVLKPVLKELQEKPLLRKKEAQKYERMYYLIDRLSQWEKAGEKTWRSIAETFYIDVPIPSTNPDTLLQDVSVVILDTPGTDSDYSKGLKDKMREALYKETNGLPIIVADKVDGQSEVDMLMQLQGAVSLDFSNLLLVINKADLLFSNQISQIKEPTTQLTNRARNRIVFVSAVCGLGAKKGLVPGAESEGNWTDHDYSEIFGENAGKILKKQLYREAQLGVERSQQLAMLAESFAEKGEAEQLFVASGMFTVENEIRHIAERYALYNKSGQARLYLEEAIKEAENVFELRKKEAENLAEKAEEELDTEVKKFKDALARKFREIESLINTQFSDKIKVVEDSFLKSNNGHICPDHIKELREAYKHKENMVEKASKLASADFDEWKTKITGGAEEFWKEKTVWARNEYIRFVSESDTLTEGQKKELQDIILKPGDIERPPMVMDEKSFSYYIIWIPVFSSRRTSKSIEDKVKRAAQYRKELYIQQNRRAFNDWQDRIKNELYKRIYSWNKSLMVLRKQLDKKEADAERIKSDLSILRGSLNEVKKLIRFDDEYEEQEKLI